MRAYVDRIAAAIRREPHRRAPRVPRSQRPRRSRSTFVPVAPDAAFAH